ncbi:protein ecdysoneless homolog [Mizuhopecten yessoensis]|uniref:Protein SGT1-like n=1 Tax=Mizuhopecten yessoensis TaxID=6573 RepID=A0A210R4I7_MIZYE|nr:protein ecdysoneless homolog [Mizuhopecten yessoensis]OWF55919.1 Protein SGT1-like [Mizuhopecten yessoensis]
MAEKRKHLAEDVVEYFLFPTLPDSLNKSEVAKYLEELLDSYLAFVSPLVVDYIWQNDPFSLVVTAEGDLPAHLYGRTSFGDNIDDEWFIVYLLFKLTKQFSGLIARVVDNDEEFMLIEAADVLPKWIDPETVENRVYIYNGQLHIIPLPQSPADITSLPGSVPSISDAVQCVRTCSPAAVASASIQQAVQTRINEFPAKTKENIHYAHCYIPANLAAILEKRPHLVSQGVLAFYYRDPIDLRSCRTMQYFRPGTRVISRVKLTRCLYAQLMQQKFQPDKRSGWVLPSSINPKYKAHDLGMKLAHGFEILCARCSSNKSKAGNSKCAPQDNDMRWNRYLQSLKERGFFRGEIEGSKLYQQLMSDARQFYTDQLQADLREGSKRNTGGEILRLLDSVEFDIEAMRKAEADLSPPDDDGWLNLTPETLDDMMRKKAGPNSTEKSSNGKDPIDLSKVADSMKAFVEKISGVDGVEIPVEGEDDDDDDIQFDSTGFISAMQKMFEFDDNDSGSSSDMSEYGWEDSDQDFDDQPPSGKPSKHKHKAAVPTVKDYMDLMDRELAPTNVGKSFEKEPQAENGPHTQPKTPTNKSQNINRDIDDEDDDFQPVNIDVNTVKNMLESIGAQQGLAGPASNILNSMGVNVPQPNAEDREENVAPVPPPRKRTPKSVPTKRPSSRSTPSSISLSSSNNAAPVKKETNV